MRPPRSHASGRIGGPLWECHRARRYLCCRVISHRLVRGIANDTNTHRPRDSHQPYSVHSIASELATYNNDSHHYGDRGLSPIFSPSCVLRFCSIATAVLDALAAHACLLRRANASRESMAAEEILDLSCEPGGGLQSSTLDQLFFVYVLLDLRQRCQSRTKVGESSYNLSNSSITFSIPLTTRVNRS